MCTQLGGVHLAVCTAKKRVCFLLTFEFCTSIVLLRGLEEDRAAAISEGREGGREGGVGGREGGREGGVGGRGSIHL